MGYAATHGRKCAIVIPYTLTTATLTDFPVCFTQSNLPVAANEMFDADGTYPARSDGADIRFSSDSAGDTPLNVEVERFGIDNNPANGYAEIWVRIPSFSHTVDTMVYCWWNDPDASAVAADDVDEGSQGVWDSNFKGVWHLSEAVNNDADGYKDATSNAAHMTGTSMAITAPAGAWAGSVAAEFDGSADYMSSDTMPLSDYPYTFSAWGSSDVDTAAYTVVSFGNTAAVNYHCLEFNGSLTNDPVASVTAVPASPVRSLKTSFVASTWCHAASVLASGSSRTAYLNGVAGTEETSTDDFSTLNNITIGALRLSSIYNKFNGKIDEVRVSSSVRSSIWLAAEYAVINSIGDIEPGTPESPAAAGLEGPLVGGGSLMGGVLFRRLV